VLGAFPPIWAHNGATLEVRLDTAAPPEEDLPLVSDAGS
jgi:hypothetical protein